jgi:hypothetical protein
VSTLLLSLGKTKACFRPLAGPLELAETGRAGGPLSVGLRFVELVALAGVVSLRSQIVKVIGGHVLAELCRVGRRRDAPQRRASLRPLSVLGGV